MIRKKSKVKALALAVTCAILAGGYSGVNPVYAQDGTYDNLTVTGNITVSGDISTTESDKKAGFTVGTKKNGSSKFYTEANLTGGYGGDITYSITLKADNYGGIEVKGKDGNTENYKMAKLGTNGIVYSTNGIFVGSAENFAKANFSVDVDGALKAAGGNFSVSNSGFTAIKGGLEVTDKLTLSETDSEGYHSDYLNLDKLMSVNKLINVTDGVDAKVKYDTNGKPLITAGSGSKVGGVGFNAGALTDVKSINADDQYAKFRVAPDYSDDKGNKYYMFRAGNLKITTGKENGDLNGDITFADTNRPGSYDITLEEIVATRDRTKTVATRDNSYGNITDTFTSIGGKLRVYDKRKEGTGDDARETSLDLVTIKGDLSVDDSNTDNKVVTEDNSKFYVKGSDGSLKAASGKFTVDKDGKLISASGSKIGDVTIDGESLSYGINSITVSELVGIQGLANTVDDRTGGIQRVSDPNDSTKHSTLIEGVFLVDNNGTATITDGFKAGADGKNSLTTSGLTAKEIRAGNNNTEFFVDGGGNVVADGTLSAAGSKFFVSAEGNITASGFLSVAGDKFRVNADGSINANNKFIVGADGSLRASDDKFTADEGGNVRAIGSLKAANDKFQVGTDGSINVNQKFIVNADGSINANNKFSVDADGKLISASGSKIGGVTIDGESLSYGTNSIKVSELASDHALVNDINKGNENLYKRLSLVGVQTDVLNSRTAGIQRSYNGITKITTIENTLKVSSDGTVKINEGDDQQVIIDSNGIKVGTGSAYINNDGFKAGADGKNSLTTSGLTAKTIKAGTNNDAFTVDENGNMVAKGSLSTASGKFSVDADGAIKAANNSFSVDKDGNIAANGTLSVANGKFQIDASGVVTAGSVKMDNIDAADTSKGVTVGGVVLKDKTISAADDKFTVDADGALKAAGGNFSVDADGALKAANSNFSVDKDGKLMSANGSQIGGVTIDGEKLSAGTASITVSQLEKDNALVNDTKKGNESLYTGLSSVQTLANGLNDRTAGISRDTTGTGTAATTIEGKLKVSSDGTVKINEGAAQQVIIDSNGIKVGKNSSRMNDSYGFATTKDLYVGADSADAPTAAGSKFYVNGSDGSLKAAAGKFTIDENGNVVAKGSSKSKTLTAGTNGDEFVVDENGNLVSKGTLSAADGKFTVDADGALKAANDKFNVDKDGNVVANGALGAANGAFSVDISGNVITSGYVRLNSGANSTQLSAGGIKFIKDGTTTTIEGETVTVSSSSGNKSFNLSDMADVGQNMTNLGNRIEAEETKRAQEVSRLDTAISNETTKREQEVSRLDTAISNETTKREQEVSRLDTAISNETTKREQEVSRLDTAINDEKTKREQEVSRLDTAINDEKTKREQEVSRLDTAINDEKTKREQEVSRLDTAISNETTKREQEVSRLDTAINDEKTKREQEVSRLDTAINDEKTKREQDVADLNGRVDAVNSRVDNINTDFNNRIDAEKAEREQDVADLNGRVDTVNSRVDNISNDFNTAINDEKTKREQDVADLNGRVDTVSTNLGDLDKLDGDLKARDEYTGNSSVVGGINAEAAVRKEEVTRLDTAIADEAAARQADVARLDGRISDVSSRINKVGAMAAAIASLKTMGYDAESPTEFSIGLGQYKGETGVALGFFHYPNKNFMINVSLSTSSGEIMGGIGATWRFGHKSPQKLLDEQHEAQVKKEIAAAEAYKAARAARTKDAK